MFAVGDDPDKATARTLGSGQTLVHQYLAQGAARLFKDGRNVTAEQLIDDVFRRALCRPPTANELAACRPIVGATPSKDGVWNSEALQGIADLSDKIASDPRVADVYSLRTAFGTLSTSQFTGLTNDALGPRIGHRRLGNCLAWGVQ